jgi:Leucine rich repeat
MAKVFEIFLLACVVGKIQSVVLPCQFNDNSRECKVTALKLAQNDEEVIEVVGRHGYRQTNKDVKEVWFVRDLETEFVPANFCKFFENMERIDIYGTRIAHISRLAFNHCSKVNKVCILFTSLTHLDDDLFKDLPELKILAIYENKLVSLPQNLIANNPKITTFDARSNLLTVIDIEFPDTLTSINLESNKCISKTFSKSQGNLILFNKQVAGSCENPLKKTILAHKAEVKQLKDQIKQLEADKNSLVLEKTNLAQNISGLKFENEKLLKVSEDTKLELQLIKTNNTIKIMKIIDENIKLSLSKTNCERENQQNSKDLVEWKAKFTNVSAVSKATIEALKLNLTATDKELQDNLSKVELLSAENANTNNSLEQCWENLSEANDLHDASRVALEELEGSCNETIAELRGKLSVRPESLIGEVSKPTWISMALLGLIFVVILIGTVFYMRRRASRSMIRETINHQVSMAHLIE